MANTTTLNLDDNDQHAHLEFIKHIRNTTGWHTVQLLEQGGFKLSKRAAYVGQVGVNDWVFTVGLILGGQHFDIAIQRYKLYLVAYKVPNKKWIALNGEYPELVIECLDTSFPVWDEHGNKISPHQAKLGTSYSSLEESGNVRRKDLKLNKEALINAVRGLTDVYLDIDESIRGPEFVLTLIQMIPEAVRIEPMLSFICEYYTHNDLTAPSLPARLIEMQGAWTRVSRAIARTTYGRPFKKVWLKKVGLICDVEEAMAMYPYIKGVKKDELDFD